MRKCQKEVAAFNHDNPVGTLVRYWPITRRDPPKIGRTQAEAFNFNGTTPVVNIEGHRSCLALTHVEPLSKVDALGELSGLAKGLIDKLEPLAKEFFNLAELCETLGATNIGDDCDYAGSELKSLKRTIDHLAPDPKEPTSLADAVRTARGGDAPTPMKGFA